MLNFIFSPDWRFIGLILLIFHVLLEAYNYSKDNDKFWENFWANVTVFGVIWVVAPIAISIGILINIILNTDFEEMKKDFSEILNFKDRKSEKKSTYKESKHHEDKKELIKYKIGELVTLLKDRGWVRKTSWQSDKLDFKYASYEYMEFDYSKSDILTIIDASYEFIKDKDFLKIHNKLYDITIGVIDFYISIMSDGFLKRSEATRLIRDFNTEAKTIVRQIINEEDAIITETKRKEREVKDAKEKELAKISYEKLNVAKDNMLDTLNIVAGIKK